MKKLITVLGLFVLGTGVWAQNHKGAKIRPVSQAIQNNGFTMQVGLPFLGQNMGGATRVTNPADVRFPWDVLYIYNTFAEDYFDVSKGFYGDKIAISWDLKSNTNLVKSIKIYRRIYSEQNNTPYSLVVSVSPTQTTYEDKYIEGGVLYEYKVQAEGISSIPALYSTYITGIGYRNPTAVVTGNVSYKGGNPVKDVIVTATRSGSTNDSGSALSIPATGFLNIDNLNSVITNSATFQAWVKPQVAYSNSSEIPIKLFNLSNSQGTDNLDATIKLDPISNAIEVNIGSEKYSLLNYFPSGKLNARGDDFLVPVTEFNNSFVHVSVVLNDGQIPLLYINGRLINTAYKVEVDKKLKGSDSTYKEPYFDVVVPTGNIAFNGSTWNNVKVGGGHASYIDEIRIWNAAIEQASIRTDYSRFINGNDARLITYLRANEKTGAYAYDLSRNGFNYNQNHGQLWNSNTNIADKVLWTTTAANYPTTSQLGVLGVTDSKGNYQISAIQYSGTGESYTITPMYGQHKFEPSQQLVYLGQGSEVVNKIDFVDKSSFSFKGKVQFDTRNVFPSFVEVEEVRDNSNSKTSWIAGGSNILDEGYNSYEINGEQYAKGTHWKNDAGTPNDTSDDFLDIYAAIFTEGANVYIDGNIVLDANNMPVVTDAKGEFDISVPIGLHSITVKKEGHEFAYGGRFPAANGQFKEYFEDSNSPTYFIDNTKVTVVGKVVGGTVESGKTIGFGEDNLLQQSVTNEGITSTIEISAKNNIGSANFTLGYAPAGANVTNYTKFNFATNAKSGEYRVAVMPLKYNLPAEDLIIKNSASISLLKTGTTEIFDFSKIPTVKTPEITFKDNNIDKTITGKPYHYEKSFTYRSLPELEVIEQSSDAVVNISKDVTITTSGFAYPVYSQFHPYKIVLSRFERYTNNDSSPAVEVTVPVTDGELIKNNNLALVDSEKVVVDGSKLIYTFKAGLPSISPPFTITSTLKYRINEVDYAVKNFKDTGIILGGKDDGSKTFVTKGPTVPDIILRDPPGSNSFASINKGESFSITTDEMIVTSNGLSTGIKNSLGVKVAFGGGLLGPVTEVKTVLDVSGAIGLSTTSEFGKTMTKTYTFNQSISTSDDPLFDGSDGDLYIGNSTNYFYGSYADVQASKTVLSPDSAELKNSKGESIFISRQKAMYFVEEPSPTFFVYSQKNILNTIIPDIQTIIDNINKGIIKETDPGVKKKKEYESDINLWKTIILNNERSKYIAKNDRATYRDGLFDKINSTSGQLNDLSAFKAMVTKNFAENISFDAGVGEITKSVESGIVKGSSTNISISIDESFSLDFGLTLNDLGFIKNVSGSFNQNINNNETQENTTTTEISYTLKDNDKSNFLSVDVVNLFDGNGPVFITQGGKTSCPHEGAELSHFYNKLTYDPKAKVIDDLAEDKREQLSFATQKVEVPLLSVTDNDVSNIAETKKAEFELKLENNSASGSDTDFLLIVDNTTNPNNALINVEPNGTIVRVPYGKTVIYKLTLGKSISDVYEYKDIKVRLQSLCDGANVSSEVLLSAHFIPSCSSVTVSAPLSNWVYNKEKAFNTDGTTKPLSINLMGYSTKFKSFKKIDLEYRLASSPSWIRLQTYYGSTQFYNDALANNETQIAAIGAATNLTYNFDIAALKLLDGNYEIRARSTCTNDTEYISDVITGRVDINSPQLFGTPLPIDGILGVGEDLKISFNENIFYNSAVSTIEIKGQTNQLPIDHNVSLRFEGASNTAVIDNPKIASGDISLEFWMNNETKTSSPSMILSQEAGVSIGLVGTDGITFTIGGITTQGILKNDNQFHHYTFTYNSLNGDCKIFEDDNEIGTKTATPNLSFTNNNALVIGGNSFIGNIHDLRIWKKAIGRAEAYAKMYAKLSGNEANLLGYWPMDEGRDFVAKDLARYKHATVKASWDIKPKGTSYEFKNGQYLAMDKVNFVQLTNEMDATIEFWIKTETAQEATLFSNGKGDGSDLVQSNGLANKWSLDMNNAGILELKSEGKSYPLTTKSVTDNAWHHVTLLFNRIGSLRTYVDTELVSSNQMTNIGGFSGNKIWLGARGSHDLAGIETVDRVFKGKIDEFRLWNTVRNVEQVNRDSYHEVDVESIGLMLYARMSAPTPATANGPRYYHADVNRTVVASNANLSSGVVQYSNDVPAIKPERALTKFLTTHVIKDGEMVLSPIVTDWASLEGQILDITVHRMFDSANNMQQSPATWTAYVNRNEVSWFAEGFNDIVDIVKNSGETKKFEITLVNKGGKKQPFKISGLPSWLSLSQNSGTIEPASKVTITATIDKEITVGEYVESLYLQTDFGLDQKLQVKLRVLATEPNWNVDPNRFDYSMNIIGKIKVDGVLSTDSYDKIAAFYNDEVRGSIKLVYNESYKEYFAFLTVYGKTASGEELKFKIWDASQGRILEASIDTKSSITFSDNEVIGTLSKTSVFANSGLIEQEIALNNGWTWLSFNVNDQNFKDLNAITRGLTLDTSNRILSHSPAQLETYYKDKTSPSNSGWSGTVSANGGLSVVKMYKVNLTKEQMLTTKGSRVDVSKWIFPIKENWNWLPYPLTVNKVTNEALAYFDAKDGDVIKSQNLFAVYDPIIGWHGTLKYLESGKGYMIKSSKEQTFKYPNLKGENMRLNSKSISLGDQETIRPEFKQYSENMNAIVLLPKGFNELFVYDSKGVMKGVTKSQIVNGVELSFITIYGENPEMLSFSIGDGFAKKITSKTINFQSNAILGTIMNPIVIDDISSGTSVYPNPFDSKLTVKVSAIKEQEVTVRLYTITGQLQLTKKAKVESGDNTIELSPTVPQGVYMIQVEMDGKLETFKVIKN